MRKMKSKKTRPTYADGKKAIDACVNAAILLWDYDGYYNPKTKNGNVVELANLIDDAFMILNNGKHWDPKKAKS